MPWSSDPETQWNDPEPGWHNLIQILTIFTICTGVLCTDSGIYWSKDYPVFVAKVANTKRKYLKTIFIQMFSSNVNRTIFSFYLV